MPTGYTADIEKGITFKQFTLNCARNFGALISMRDDPAGTPIPDEFKPSEYAAKRLLEIQAELNEISHLTLEQTTIFAEQEYQSALSEYEKTSIDRTSLEKKYREMMANVKSWNPPTPGHQGLKDFMIQQIEESIRFDCGMDYYPLPQLKPAIEWLKDKKVRLLKDFQYYTQEDQKEKERTGMRNAWIKSLKNSLT